MYLVLKGIAGFGDRLMTLARAMQLAAHTGRTLVIDWSQDSWNHDEVPKGFWHYFDLKGISALKLVRGDDETYATLDRLSARSTDTIPAIFCGNLRRTDWGLKGGRLFIGDVPVQLSEQEITDATVQVVVYLAYCSGPLEGILPYLVFRSMDFASPKYVVGVHFRNTDKANPIGAILERTAHVWRSGRSIYLSTDDPAAIAVFRTRFGNDVTTSKPPPRPASGGGIHHCTAEELAAVGTNKEELTNDMLRDILCLVNSVVFVDSPNSLFSRIVHGLRGARPDLKQRIT